MNILKSEINTKNPWGHRWLPFIPFVFAGAIIADLAIQNTRVLMLPTQSLPPRPQQHGLVVTTNSAVYQPIANRNIFSSDGIIPESLRSQEDPNHRTRPEEPVPSSLPLNLIGTLVHSNPEKSIAAIEVKSKNQILSFTPKKEIENIATVERVERGKVIIRNNNNGQLEFIEIKSNNKVSFEGTTPKPTSPANKGEVKQLGQNQFEISRADLMKYTSDLSSILMQARAVPAQRPGSGEIYGFRLLEVQPGSIYTQLGLRPMDVICGVNGSSVTSAQQAMELYTALRSSNGIQLCVERDGKNNNFSYTITQ